MIGVMQRSPHSPASSSASLARAQSSLFKGTEDQACADRTTRDTSISQHQEESVVDEDSIMGEIHCHVGDCSEEGLASEIGLSLDTPTKVQLTSVEDDANFLLTHIHVDLKQQLRRRKRKQKKPPPYA